MKDERVMTKTGHSMGLPGNVLLYMHAGSGNHGCEAIVYTTVRQLCGLSQKEQTGAGTADAAGRHIVVASVDPEEDRRYGIRSLEEQGLCSLAAETHIAQHKLAHVLLYGYRAVTGDRESFLRYRFKNALDMMSGGSGNTGEKKLAISVGGDNYCYPELHADLRLTNSMLRKKGYRTALLGCSIEPELIPGLAGDLREFDRIVARESITFEALCNAGAEGGIDPDRVSLHPDPAFLLEPAETGLPEGFQPGGTVGVNLSPMVRDQYGEASVVMENYVELIKSILSETDMSVALIPHVVKPNGDDRRVHAQLAERFPGETRLIQVTDRSAAELKYIIGKCACFVGARTHATIAAYSQSVPTLVIGYSVKSKGIALDLFGDDREGLVLPVQSLREKDDLANAFRGISERRKELRDRLDKVMPGYKERAGGVEEL